MGANVFYLSFAMLIFSSIGLLLYPLILKPSPQAQRVFQLVGSARADRRKPGLRERFEQRVMSLATELRASLGVRVNARSAEQLHQAGLRLPGDADVFFAAQFLMPLIGAFAGSFVPSNTLFWVLVFAVVGYAVPNIWLAVKVKSRNDRIRYGLPDVIDLLVICADAGLGLDQAVLRVCAELSISHRDIQEELTRVHLEQRAGTPRLEAWQHFALRHKIPELTSFVGMLMQTDRFGTPIARALSSFAEELRTARRQLAEEAASKTKIKIIFPLVFCIFPCLFLVMLAPALFGILQGLKQMAR